MNIMEDPGASTANARKKASIDPLNLLECLRVLLNDSGGIKNVQSVHRLVVLMAKYCKKLVSKCMYLHILLATDSSVLDVFYKDGGWRMISEWLSEGITKKNWALAHLVLNLLNVSPITLERLNDSELIMVKQVKSLSVSCTHKGVSDLAQLLVLHWTRMLTAATTQTGAEKQLVTSETDDKSPTPTGLPSAALISPTKTFASSNPSSPAVPTPSNLSSIINATYTSIPPSSTSLVTPTVSSYSSAIESTAPVSGIPNSNNTATVIPTSSYVPVTSSIQDSCVSTTINASSNSVNTSIPIQSAVKLGNNLSNTTSDSLNVKTEKIPSKTEDDVEDNGEGDEVFTMHQQPILPKYMPAKKPKLKNRSKFNAAKRVKSVPVKSVITSSPETLVVQSSVLVTTPQPNNFIEHIASMGKPSTAVRGRGRRRVNVESGGESDARSDSPNKNIKITIKSGTQVLAEVKKNTKEVPKALSSEFVESDGDDDDETKEKKESDEDFVVEEWKEAPGKKVKKRVRVTMIESDDSMDSLPNLDTEAKPHLVNGEAKSSLLQVKDEAADKSLLPNEKERKDGLVDVKEGENKTKITNIKVKKVSISRSDSVNSDNSEKKLPKKIDEDKDRTRHSSGSKKSKDKDRTRTEDKDKSRSDKSKSDKDYERRKEKKYSDSDRKNGSSSYKEREREREREKRREKERRERKDKDRDQLEKDRSTLEKVKPLSIDGMAKIPKKPASFLDALGSADPSESPIIRKPPVKMKSSSFRSTGLLDPPVSKPAGIAGKRAVPAARNGDVKSEGELRANKRPLDLPNSHLPDKKLKSTISSTPLTADRPGGAKFISPKRPSLSDDGGFMAALDAVSPKADAKRPKFPPTSSPSSSTAARKRKLSDTDDADTKSTKAADGDKAAKTSEADTNKSASDTIPAAADTKAAKSGENDNTPGADSSKSADAAEESSAGSSLLSPSVERPKLNFYKDALEDLGSEEATKEDTKKAEASADTTAADADKPEDAVAATADGDTAVTEENTPEDMEICTSSPVPPAENYEKVEVTFSHRPQDIKSALVLVRRPGTKKSVRFRPEENLERIHYFELDETERVNVNAQKFQDMLLMDKHAERDVMDKQRGKANTCMQYGPWKLLPIHLPEGTVVVVPGYKSLERHVQAKREYSNMPTFFPPNRLPDTPMEPDPEPCPRTEPKLLPLTDMSGQDSVKSVKHIPWPDPVVGGPPPPNPPNFYRPPANQWRPPHPAFRPNGGEYYPDADPMAVGGPAGAMMGAPGMTGMPPVGGGANAGNGGHWVVGSANTNQAPPPHAMPKPGDPPMFTGPGMMPPRPGFGPPGMPGPPGPMGPMGPPPPHMGYGGWGGGVGGHDQDGGGRFRGDGGGWRRGGGVDRGRGRGGWGRGRPPSQTPCRHFMKGGCRNGDDCAFSHHMP